MELRFPGEMKQARSGRVARGKTLRFTGCGEGNREAMPINMRGKAGNDLVQVAAPTKAQEYRQEQTRDAAETAVLQHEVRTTRLVGLQAIADFEIVPTPLPGKANVVGSTTLENAPACDAIPTALGNITHGEFAAGFRREVCLHPPLPDGTSVGQSLPDGFRRLWKGLPDQDFHGLGLCFREIV